METKTISPRLGVKEIIPFSLFFSFFFTFACSSSQYSDHFRIYCLTRAKRGSIESYRWQGNAHDWGIYTSDSGARTKMFAQPAINNVDGIKCIWRRSQSGHHPAPQTLAKDDFFFGRIEIYFAAKSACLPQRRPENCARAENAWWLDVISPVCNFPSYYESSTMTG